MGKEDEQNRCEKKCPQSWDELTEKWGISDDTRKDYIDLVLDRWQNKFPSESQILDPLMFFGPDSSVIAYEGDQIRRIREGMQSTEKGRNMLKEIKLKCLKEYGDQDRNALLMPQLIDEKGVVNMLIFSKTGNGYLELRRKGIIQELEKKGLITEDIKTYK